ncbi:MAG: CidA/LrgA family protein [Oscillospiraceae bacterium]|nr:CidA/LrgA family protein [Oscillospiraceae bacterium]
MKYITQLLYILLFTGLGELLEAVVPLPVPAAIYGLVLMLIALCTGILKPEKIADTAHFLIAIMPFLFVAPAVNILRYFDIIRSELVAICVVMVVSTVIVFAVSGLVTKLLLKKEVGKDD